MTKNISFSKASPLFIVGIGLIALTLVVMAVPKIADAALYRQLEIGMSGADVSELQTFLAEDPTLYPQGLVTGYFGSLTKSAVSNFQARNGISSVGRVGPATLPILISQMAGGVSNGQRAPIISGVGINTTQTGATLNWGTNELARGVVYYSENPLILTEHLTSVDVTGARSARNDTSLRAYQSVPVSSLSANTVYHYIVYATDQNGNVSISWPSTFRTTN